MIILSLFGCVERRIRVATDPPNAAVFLDGKQVGETPTEIDFDFYGTREITVVKKGYHIESHKEKIEAPIYQVFPIDLFADLLNPFTLEDNHDFYYTLRPYIPVAPEKKRELLDRAVKLRQETKGNKENLK